MLGGIDSCGRMLCCSTFRDFEPVSIKMAKDQNLSLNPAKSRFMWSLNVLLKI